MRLMPGKAAIPVRLSREMIERIDQAAATVGSNRSAVMRLCIETFVAHIEQHGKAVLPPDWEAICSSMDGRRKPRATRKKA